MDISIANKKTNRLLKREEFELKVSGSLLTPSRKELREKIAHTVGSKPDLVAIQRIEQQFGTHTNRVWCRAYEDAEQLKKLELRHIVGRDAGQKYKPVKKKKEPKAKKGKK